MFTTNLHRGTLYFNIRINITDWLGIMTITENCQQVITIDYHFHAQVFSNRMIDNNAKTIFTSEVAKLNACVREMEDVSSTLSSRRIASFWMALRLLWVGWRKLLGLHIAIGSWIGSHETDSIYLYGKSLAKGELKISLNKKMSLKLFRQLISCLFRKLESDLFSLRFSY